VNTEGVATDGIEWTFTGVPVDCALQVQGIECYVVDPASIPVQRHRRRAKTDRLDAIRLVINQRAWLHGERDRMHVVRVPSAQDEAARHLLRERGQLQKEVLQHLDRMRKLLATLGCWEDVAHRAFAERLERLRLVRRENVARLVGKIRFSPALTRNSTGNDHQKQKRLHLFVLFMRRQKVAAGVIKVIYDNVVNIDIQIYT